MYHVPPRPPILRPDQSGIPYFDTNGPRFEHNVHQPAIQAFPHPDSGSFPPHFEHKYNTAFQVIQQPLGHGPVSDSGSFPSNIKPPIFYVGYILSKQPCEKVGQTETWKIVKRERMPAAQIDLKDQIEKHRKRGVTGLDQYNHPDMKGFKRRQIDELIQECVAMDDDKRFEYIIASIRRDTRRRLSRLETSTMHVILKRRPRQGIDMRGPLIGVGSIGLPLSGTVDLSGAIPVTTDYHYIWTRDPIPDTTDYHYNWTRDANSLSTGHGTETSVASWVKGSCSRHGGHSTKAGYPEGSGESESESECECSDSSVAATCGSISPPSMLRRGRPAADLAVDQSLSATAR